MNIQQIWDEMDRLTALMVERDIPTPRGEAWIKDGHRLQVNLWGDGIGKHVGLAVFTDESIEGAIKSAERHIAALPTKADRDMLTFQNKVAAAIDFGNEHGIDGKWINPLVDTARALASNALTAEAAQ